MLSQVQYLAAFKYRDTPGSLLDALNDPKNFSIDHYNITKLLDVCLAREMAKFPTASGVIVNSVNPGLSTSELRRDLPAPVKL